MLSRIKMRTDDVCLLDAASEWLTPEQVKAHLPPSVALVADEIDIHELLTAQKQEFSEERNVCQDEDSRFCMIDGLVYSIARPRFNLPQYPRLLLPLRYRDKVIARCHEDVGHQSLFKTMARVQETCLAWHET